MYTLLFARMDDDELDSLIAEIELEPKKPAAGQGSSAPVTAEFTLDEIDDFMADMNLGGIAARAQSAKKPVIKRTNKYTAVGAAAGNELESLLENLDPKSVDLKYLSKGTSFLLVIPTFLRSFHRYRPSAKPKIIHFEHHSLFCNFLTSTSSLRHRHLRSLQKYYYW